MAILADTHRLISSLKKQGFTEEQAAGITEAVREIDLSELATKGDIVQLERRFDQLEHRLREAELRITVKLGTLMTAGIAVLAAMNYFGPA